MTYERRCNRAIDTSLGAGAVIGLAKLLITMPYEKELRICIILIPFEDQPSESSITESHWEPYAFFQLSVDRLYETR